MADYFTADLHFTKPLAWRLQSGQDRLLTETIPGPYENPEHHDTAIIDLINATVPRKARLWVLGDFCGDGSCRINSLRQRIRCREVNLVLGNHDKPSIVARSCAFSNVYLARDIKLRYPIDGGKFTQRCYLSHYPHAYWPASHYGAWHLYGHLHSRRELTLSGLFPGRRSLDVGVDNAVRLLGKPRPFTQDDLWHILGADPGHDPLEFYSSELTAPLWTEIA